MIDQGQQPEDVGERRMSLVGQSRCFDPLPATVSRGLATGGGVTLAAVCSWLPGSDCTARRARGRETETLLCSLDHGLRRTELLNKSDSERSGLAPRQTRCSADLQ